MIDKYEGLHVQIAEQLGISYGNVQYARKRLYNETGYSGVVDLITANLEKIKRYEEHKVEFEKIISRRESQMMNPRNGRWVNDIARRRDVAKQQSLVMDKLILRTNKMIEWLRSLTEEQIKILLKPHESI